VAAFETLTLWSTETIGKEEEETRRTSRARTDSCMNHRVLALSLAVVGSMLLAWSAQAQGHAAFGVASRGPGGGAFSRGGGTRPGFVRMRRGRRIFAGSGFWPYFDPDDSFEQDVIETPQPQVIVVPSGQPPAPAQNPRESLVIEFQGDHWVRLTSASLSSAIPSRAHAAEAPSELPHAVLVFRDGRREEIGKYVIVGPTIYASADYWSSGSWTRKVQIAELDVPATLKLNQERGTRFSLPSGPNEVMIRP
jgi:hypothetical protein